MLNTGDEGSSDSEKSLDWWLTAGKWRGVVEWSFRVGRGRERGNSSPNVTLDPLGVLSSERRALLSGL